MQYAHRYVPFRTQQEGRQGFAVVPTACDATVVVMQASIPWLVQAAAAASRGGCGARFERYR